MSDVARILRDADVLDESECYIDTPCVPTKSHENKTGPARISRYQAFSTIIVFFRFLLASNTLVVNYHEVILVQPSFDFHMIEVSPDNLISNCAYDRDKMNEKLRQCVSAMVAPRKNNRA